MQLILPHPVTANPLREGEVGGVIASFIGPLTDPCAGGEVEGTAKLTDELSSKSPPEEYRNTTQADLKPCFNHTQVHT